MPDITPVVLILDGVPVSSINPLPTSGGGGGGGGIVEQGKQGSTMTAGPLRNEDRNDWNPADEVDVGL